jgi:hypothetical protein
MLLEMEWAVGDSVTMLLRSNLKQEETQAEIPEWEANPCERVIRMRSGGTCSESLTEW